MISAHLAAEMDLAMRLEMKLAEVQMRLQSPNSKSQGTSESGKTATSGAGASEASMYTASSGVVKKTRSDMELGKEYEAFPMRVSSLYQRAEWEILMGREGG